MVIEVIESRVLLLIFTADRSSELQHDYPRQAIDLLKLG
jgi:2-succinyl-5-enolpyruvyl-6-hydroxy-3-cyclohexene-1-carboxylate synthase